MLPETTTDPFNTLISHSPGLESVIRSAQIAASADVTVLIQGETGTGKELLAQAIHQSSPRKDEQMIIVNCAALTDSLLESQLFGHVAGAFTGAIADSTGYIKAADNSTLFLDEIAELSDAGQAALLRFLEAGECQKVGSTQTLRVDVRVVAASHRDLRQQVDAGKFRADLFYRLNVVTLTLPPLRTRPRDIPLLVQHFTQLYSSKQSMPTVDYDRSAIRRMQQHDWPGNVRELRNLCARCVTLNRAGTTITDSMISEQLAIQSSSLDASLFQLPDSGIKLEDLECDLLKQALSKTNGNKTQAARLLGISRDAFLYRLKKHSL